MYMSEKVKVGIGAPTYNSVARLEQLLTSIELYRSNDYEYRIVILDDGTPNQEKRDGVRDLAIRFGVDFIQHKNNEGIPSSWNDLSNHFKDIDIMFLFNDDICLCNENIFKCTVYALQNNEKVAVVGYPLIQIDPITGLQNKNYSLPDYSSRPGKVGAVVGCSFAFKKKIFDQIGYFDRNIRSFYEETDQGFRVAQAGYYSIMLPYPPVEHRGSMTFSSNYELNLQCVDDSIFTANEYYDIMIKKYPKERIFPVEGQQCVYRMDYSRAYFAKKWGCKDFWDCPQSEVHERLVTPLPKINFKYLDKDLKEVECEI